MDDKIFQIKYILNISTQNFYSLKIFPLKKSAEHNEEALFSIAYIDQLRFHIRN